MKKIIFLITIVFTAFLSNAQESKFSMGVAGSYDIYNFNFYSGSDLEATPAYNIGLRVQYNFKEKLSLRTGLLYSQIGYKGTPPLLYGEDIDPIPYNLTVLKTNYLNVPLMIGYRLFSLGRFNFYPSVGFLSGILIGNTEISYWYNVLSRKTDYLNQYLNNILLSAQINLGLEYNINKKIFLSLEPYFNYGLNKMDDVIMSFSAISYGGILSLNYKL